MRKQYLPLVLALALAHGVSAQNRFDAASQMAVDYYNSVISEPERTHVEFKHLPFTLDPASRSEPTAEVLIRLNEGTTIEDIESYGLAVTTMVSDVAVASGTISDIIAFAETDLALQVSFSTEANMLLDKARNTTGVNDIHNGTGIAQPYTGKGIVTGIFDIGMDPNHVNFKDENGKCRISNLWYFGLSGRPAGYTADNMDQFETDDYQESHGTHTMGCMAGSYKGNGNYASVSLTGRVTQRTNQPIPFYGPATESEIAAACGYNSSANIVAACEKLATYIKSTGKPGLISLSFGSNLGPHDGSDTWAHALNEIAKDIPLFIAAGNEGSDNISLIGTFSKGNTQAKTFFRTTSNTGEGDIDIWSGDNRPLTVRIVVYDRTADTEIYSYAISGEKSGTISNTSNAGSDDITDANFDKAFRNSRIQFVSKLSATNNRYNIRINVTTLTMATGNTNKRYALGIVIEGAEGQRWDLVSSCTDSYGRLTAELTSWDKEGWLNAGNDFSISNLACGNNAICIGAWNTRRQWGTLAGQVYSYQTDGMTENNIAGYSSYGKLVDGRTLPYACAPGTGIISSVSKYYVSSYNNELEMVAMVNSSGTKHYYDAMQGTSMATPVAAGICALWLQANPDLTPADIQYIIKTTSTVDQFVTSTTDRPEAWGYGKINALEGIKKAVTITGVADVKANPADIVILENGNNWQVVAPGAASVKTVIYDLNGRPVVNTSASGDTAEISGENLQPGIYIITVNDTLSRRIAVK